MPSDNLESRKEIYFNYALKSNFASFINLFLRFPTRIFTALWLGVTGVGLIAIVGLITKYSIYTELGIRSSISREIAKEQNNDDFSLESNYESIGLVWTFFNSFLYCSCIVVINKYFGMKN